MNVIIRKEQPSDIESIEKVTTQAFLNAPHTDHTEQFIVSALRKSEALSLSLVAELNEKVIGHVAVSPVVISDGSKDWFGLGPISVVPSLQGKGIGSKLMNKAIEQLRKMGASGCVLLGEPDYYGRFGFRAESNLVLPGVPPDYFQVLLIKGAIPTGIVVYHESFNAQE